MEYITNFYHYNSIYNIRLQHYNILEHVIYSRHIVHNLPFANYIIYFGVEGDTYGFKFVILRRMCRLSKINFQKCILESALFINNMEYYIFEAKNPTFCSISFVTK